jgi:hypothetical protein
MQTDHPAWDEQKPVVFRSHGCCLARRADLVRHWFMFLLMDMPCMRFRRRLWLLGSDARRNKARFFAFSALHEHVAAQAIGRWASGWAETRRTGDELSAKDSPPHNCRWFQRALPIVDLNKRDAESMMLTKKKTERVREGAGEKTCIVQRTRKPYLLTS